MEQIIREIKLARGILIHQDKVLLTQDIRPGQGHFFLPGGNVEPGEAIKNSLPREWQEELGWTIQVNSFLGCLEHSWNYNRKQDSALVEVFEINFLFSVSTSIETLSQPPISKESHLKFSWISINELSSINLLPAPLRILIPDIANSKPKGIWASTLS